MLKVIQDAAVSSNPADNAASAGTSAKPLIAELRKVEDPLARMA